MRAVAIRMVFRFPAAADRDRRRFVEFQNAGSDARDYMRAIAEGRIFCPRASAVGDACRYLSDNGGFDEIVVGEWHGTSFPGCKDEDYSEKLRVSTTVLRHDANLSCHFEGGEKSLFQPKGEIFLRIILGMTTRHGLSDYNMVSKREDKKQR